VREPEGDSRTDDPPAPGSPARPRRRARRLLGALRDAALLPFALVIVVAEDVLWRGLRALLDRLTQLAAVQALRAQLGRLPGWAALPLFLIPEAAGRAGEVWAAVLLVHRHATAAALVYIFIRLFAAVIAVFIWHACQPALMRLAWFARLVTLTLWVRDWALARTAPLRAWARGVLRRIVRGRDGRLGARIGRLRARLARRIGLRRAPGTWKSRRARL
jgi:hypothetical protein